VCRTVPQCKIIHQWNDSHWWPGCHLLYWAACRLELWDSDAVFITQNLHVGYNVDQLDLHAYIGKKTNVGISNTCTLCSYYCRPT